MPLRPLDYLRAPLALLRLGVQTGFRFRGPYWQWRLHTAFGRGYPASKLELVRSILEYGAWAARIRSLR